MTATMDRTYAAAEGFEEATERPATLSVAARRMLAVTRIATGGIFLWAFADKTFGLGYATPSAKAWIHGGSPTKGFLANVEVGPQFMQDFFHYIAGTPIADWGFMLGMLGIGLALILGAGLRVAAVGTTIMMAMMWTAEWPLAAGSSNPLIDYHVIYALVAIICALTYAGRTWGIGSWWERVVGRNRWLV